MIGQKWNLFNRAFKKKGKLNDVTKCFKFSNTNSITQSLIMDLLGGYDSNAESDSDSDDENKPLVKETTKEDAPIITQTNKAEKRGRKILSLNAVLPSNIFNQLVMQKGQKGDDDESLSSSDEEENGKSRKRCRLNDSKDGIQSLLHDLNSLNGAKLIPSIIPSAVTNSGGMNSVGGDTIRSQKQEPDEVIIPNETEKVATRKETRSLAYSSIPRPSNIYKNTLPRPTPQQPTPIQQQQRQQQQPAQALTQKEIIKSLRQGQIPSSIPTIQISNTATPSQIEVTPDHKESSIPNPELELYNPSQGKMVSAHEVRHKRKNQIHHLLKQAHVLEANRPVAGSTSSSRVDAKKKYGW